MNTEKLLILGFISTLTADQQAEVTKVAQGMRDMIESASEGVGIIALSLVATEIQN